MTIDDCFAIISIITCKSQTTIEYGNYALKGDPRDNRKTIINGHESYDNTLIMKSKLK